MAAMLSASRGFGRSALPALAAVLGLAALGCSGSSDDETDEHFSRVVYAVRQHTYFDGQQWQTDVAGGMGQVMDYGRYHPGGRLEIKNLKTGAIDNIIADQANADIASVDVSFDATKVLFSMKTSSEDSYHLYWANLEPNGEGRYETHQLTFGPYDDQHGIWLAGDRIAFITNQSYTEMGTRADEYNHAQVVTQIATITLGGGDADRKLCSQNLSHTINLFSLSDGRVGFSRWEHLENVNDVKLFGMNPDCTQMVAISGQHGKEVAGEGFNSIVQITETNTNNVFVGIGTDREETIQGGALIRVDTRSAFDTARIDEERPLFESLTPTVPLGMEPSSVGRYRSPAVLPDGRILVSWADGFVNALSELSLTPPDYGIYLYNLQDRRNELVQNYEDTWELYAKPIAARTTPPVLSSTQDTVDATRATEIGSIDVRSTSLGTVHGETVAGAQFGSEGVSIDEALGQAKKVRIIEGFSSEGAPGTTMFGLTMAEGAALLGEADVYSDGSWLAKIPPYLPVHLQPIDEFELAIRSQTTWIQGMPNESRVCGGCHESRTEANLPGGGVQTIAAGKGAQNFFDIVSRRIEYPWAYAKADYIGNEVQRIFDASCVSCHNSTTNGNGPQEYYTVTMTNEATGAVESFPVPRLDLSTTPVTVTYDRETREWPASYVSLFYPAALRMEMDAAQVTGEVPPEWAVPSAARESALLEKLNVTSLLDATRYAWPLGEAFSDASIKGATRTDHAAFAQLTRADLTILIRAIDMGGQFYARQNSDFVPYANDPVSPGGTQY